MPSLILPRPVVRKYMSVFGRHLDIIETCSEAKVYVDKRANCYDCMDTRLIYSPDHPKADDDGFVSCSCNFL